MKITLEQALRKAADLISDANIAGRQGTDMELVQAAHSKGSITVEYRLTFGIGSTLSVFSKVADVKKGLVSMHVEVTGSVASQSALKASVAADLLRRVADLGAVIEVVLGEYEVAP